MTIITHDFTNQSVSNKASNSSPVSELILKIGEKLLIVVVHRKTGEVASHGILLFRHDSLLQWSDEHETEASTDPAKRIRELNCNGFVVYVAQYGAQKRVWYEYYPVRARFGGNEITFFVDRTDFSLKGDK